MLSEVPIVTYGFKWLYSDASKVLVSVRDLVSLGAYSAVQITLNNYIGVLNNCIAQVCITSHWFKSCYNALVFSASPSSKNHALMLLKVCISPCIVISPLFCPAAPLSHEYFKTVCSHLTIKQAFF